MFAPGFSSGLTPSFNAYSAPTLNRFGQQTNAGGALYNPAVARTQADYQPTDYTAIGSAVAGLTPEQQGGLAEYYSDPNNFATLGSYIHGTYTKQGTQPTGVDWTDASSYGRQIFGTPWANEWDYSKLNPESLTSAFGPNANQIFSDARDWELRDISRQNQQGSLAKTLAGAAGSVIGGLTGNPLIGLAAGGAFGGASGGPIGALTGAAGGYSAGLNGGYAGLLDKTKNFLGINNTAFVNPNALPSGLAESLYSPASSAAVPGNFGLGLTSANLYNPLALGGAIAGPTSLTGGTYIPGEGFINDNGLGIDSADLYNPPSLSGLAPREDWLSRLDDISGVSDLLSAFSGQEDEQQFQGGGAGPESGFGGGIGAGSQPMSMIPGQGQTGQQPLDSFIDPLINSSAEEGAPGQGIDYQSQKLLPGPNQRLPGYQTQPFGNALAQNDQLFNSTR